MVMVHLMRGYAENSVKAEVVPFKTAVHVWLSYFDITLASNMISIETILYRKIQPGFARNSKLYEF